VQQPAIVLLVGETVSTSSTTLTMIVGIIAALLAACASDPVNQSRNRACASISESEAVSIAQRFVRDRGYTNEPGDPETLAREQEEQNKVTDYGLIDVTADVIAERPGTIEPKAVGIKDVSSQQGGVREACWAVAFKFGPSSYTTREIPEELSRFGRAVLIDDRRSPRFRHEGWPLEYLDRRFERSP
jgi:hypothetical protein